MKLLQHFSASFVGGGGEEGALRNCRNQFWGSRRLLFETSLNAEEGRGGGG